MAPEEAAPGGKPPLRAVAQRLPDGTIIEGIEALTDREREVLKMIAAGADPKKASTEGGQLDAVVDAQQRAVVLEHERGDGQLVGVVRQQDIIKYLAESFPEELLNLPPRPHQRMKEPEGA